MEDVIRSWGLDDAILDVLVANQIDEKTLSELTPELIAELFPLVGPRMKFLAKWRAEYIEQTNDNNVTVNGNPADSDSTDSVAECGEPSTRSQKKYKKFKLERQDGFSNKITFALRSGTLCVGEILQRSIKGQAIVKAYGRAESLSEKSRNIIVDIILTEVVTATKCLKNEDFEFLAKKICKLFPTEVVTVYYTPPIQKKHSRFGKPITSRGKLVDKYRNILRQCKLLITADDGSTSDTTNKSDGNREACEEIAEHIAWLKKNAAPWEEVMSKWEVTHSYRRGELTKNRKLRIHEIYASWPVLGHPDGFLLIRKDFSLLELTSVKNDFKTWNTFFTILQEICPPKKDEHSNLLKEFLQQDDITEDCRVVLQLLLLSHMVPPRGRITIPGKPKTRHWKPSITECKSSILVHAITPGDVSRLQEERIEVMQSFGLTVQPYIIVVGPSLHQLSTFYLAINKVLYKVPSTLEALNACFETFHALEATYPPESEHLWLLLQRGLFKITTMWDKSIPYIMGVISLILEHSKHQSADDTS